MSVVVLGMEMPESCSSCDFFYDFCRCTQLNYNFYHEDGEPNVFAERLPDCPLRPLPEKHGRLIDAERLREEFPYPSEGMGGWRNPNEAFVHKTGVWAEIDCAETIVEAED